MLIHVDAECRPVCARAIRAAELWLSNPTPETALVAFKAGIDADDVALGGRLPHPHWQAMQASVDAGLGTRRPFNVYLVCSRAVRAGDDLAQLRRDLDELYPCVRTNL